MSVGIVPAVTTITGASTVIPTAKLYVFCMKESETILKLSNTTKRNKTKRKRETKMMTYEEKLEKKVKIAAAQELKKKMTCQEKIDMLNTPWQMLPSELQPGMVKYPQMFNFIRMNKPKIGQQKETFGARLVRYREKYHLSRERFCEICNEYASDFDVPGFEGRRAQRTRITIRDLSNYEDFNVCPKIDKMTVISEAMGYSLDYFAGYGPKSRKSKKETIEALSRANDQKPA